MTRWWGGVIALDHLKPPYTMAALEGAGDATLKAFLAEPEVVYQAAFFDGEFFGYADFIERADDGWLVCDAKLARQAKPRALIQLGAYAEQIRKIGLPLSSTVSLLLGNGDRANFRVADVLPAFLERRDRLRSLIATHRSGGQPVGWGDDAMVACGKCAECKHAATQANDLILVAGLRMEQRRKLRAITITTIADLAGVGAKPDGMAQATFEKLRAQAALQWRQMQAGDGAPVEYELAPTAATTLALLPGPSEGDLFFDFEGDPLYDEGDFSRKGVLAQGVLAQGATQTVVAEAPGPHSETGRLRGRDCARPTPAAQKYFNERARRRLVIDPIITPFGADSTSRLVSRGRPRDTSKQSR